MDPCSTLINILNISELQSIYLTQAANLSLLTEPTKSFCGSFLYHLDMFHQTHS